MKAHELIRLGDLLNLERTLIMGVLNVTPDSFSDGDQFFSKKNAVEHALQMESEGADIIDIGGESSRPGSDPVSREEEEHRVLCVIETLVSQLKIPISIDTRRSVIARKALELGVQIVNDISGFRDDPDMAEVVSQSDAFAVIMHMKGTPKNMQLNPHYENLIEELIEFFKERINYAHEFGIQDNRIIVDPGIGFGKRLDDNFVILKNLRHIAEIGYPVLVGTSRKSFIGILSNLPPDERLEGTAASVTASILNGAKIVRVHDVKQMKRVVTIADAVNREGV